MPGRGLLLMVACLAAATKLTLVLARPTDTEGAAFSFMPEYVQWVQQNCSDPANVTQGPCKALKETMCGTRDTSEVLCLPGPTGPEARFRSASRYTRVTYLTCSLTALRCSTDKETYDGPARFVNPMSLAAWVSYVKKCTGSRYDPKTTPPGVCAQLSGDHCSRPDVRCSKDTADFLDANKQVVLSGNYTRGLAFLK